MRIEDLAAKIVRQSFANYQPLILKRQPHRLDLPPYEVQHSSTWPLKVLSDLSVRDRVITASAGPSIVKKIPEPLRTRSLNDGQSELSMPLESLISQSIPNCLTPFRLIRYLHRFKHQHILMLFSEGGFEPWFGSLSPRQMPLDPIRAHHAGGED